MSNYHPKSDKTNGAYIRFFFYSLIPFLGTIYATAKMYGFKAAILNIIIGFIGLVLADGSVLNNVYFIWIGSLHSIYLLSRHRNIAYRQFMEGYSKNEEKDKIELVDLEKHFYTVTIAVKEQSRFSYNNKVRLAKSEQELHNLIGNEYLGAVRKLFIPFVKYCTKTNKAVSLKNYFPYDNIHKQCGWCGKSWGIELSNYKIIGWYWEKANKDGSRDKRVKDNQQFGKSRSIYNCKNCGADTNFFHHDSTNPTKDLSFWKRSLLKKGNGQRKGSDYVK